MKENGIIVWSQVVAAVLIALGVVSIVICMAIVIAWVFWL